MLYDAEGQPLDRYTSQRRLIGLLATLIVAGEGGLTRDKLVGLLWPDYAPERARHSLTQALYAARKASGEDALFIVSENIRLDLSCIGCDVLEFQDAVRTQDFATAVELYRGPFLDGFFLQSTEFDSWLHHERLRLEDLAVYAYSCLIDQLEAELNFARAVEQARRLAAIRPTDANIAQRLMRLLAAAGDRAAALTHARTYGAMVREGHGIEPDEAVAALAETIRSTSSEAPTPETADEITIGSVVQPDAEAPFAIVGEAVSALKLHHRRHSVPWRWVAVSAVFVIAAITLAVLLRRRQTSAPLPRHRVVVAPFRVTAADARLQYLAEGMVELLSTRLADDTADQAVDAATVLRAWRDAGISGARVAPADSVLGVAREIGAERVITGSVVGTPDHVVLNAALVRVETGRLISQAVVEGSTDTLTSLIDALARRLLLKQIAAEDELSERTTLSLPALRAYLSGSGALARQDYMIALREYERALRLDSTFALAALKVGLVAARVGEFERQRSALDLAWRVRHDLSERDRAVLVALLGPNYPALSTIRESVAAWNRAARLAPDQPEAWYGLASATFNSVLHGLGGEDETIVASLNRAIGLDSTFAQPAVLLAIARGQPYHTVAPRLADAGPAALRSFALIAQVTGVLLPQGLQALQRLESHAVNAAEAMNLLVAEHSAQVLTGQSEAALEVTQRMQRLSPATHAHLRLRVLDALYGAGDSTSATAAAVQLSAITSGVVDAPANACVLAQFALARNDRVAARRLLGLMKLQTYTPVVAGVHPTPCADLVGAGLALLERDHNALAQLARLDSLDLMSIAAGDAATYAPIALARWHLLLNHKPAALQAIAARRVPAFVWPRYGIFAGRLERQITAR